MDKCEQCGFLECRCPDHVAQNYVPKYKLLELVERWRLEAGDKYKGGFADGQLDCADELEIILDNRRW